MRTCRAAFPLLLATRPRASISSTVPIGASAAVAVVTATCALSPQSEDSASPLNPNERTVDRSANAASFEVWCFSAVRERDRHEDGDEKKRGVRGRTDAVVVGGRDAAPVVDDLYGLEAVVLEADLCSGTTTTSRGQHARHVFAGPTSPPERGYAPMLEAPASKLFSTSSLTAVWRSTTTWPEVRRWTEVGSMGLMACSGAS